MAKNEQEIEETFKVVKDDVTNGLKATATSPDFKSEPTTSKSEKTDGAWKELSQFISVEREKSKDKTSDTIVDVKVHNPFVRIMKMLKDIKQHQATTVSMRFTIPLLALPIVLLAAFQLGKAQTVCASRFTSQIGTFRILSVMAPVESNDSLSILFSFFPDIPKLQKQSELSSIMRTILITPQGSILTVLHNNKTNLLGFNNQQVIVTGQYSPCTGIITLDSPQNIVGN
jgi:hypothetical protein